MRKFRFPQIENLDNELDSLYNTIKELTGKVYDKLPESNRVMEGSRILVKKDNGTLEEYVKINNELKRIV